jgi:hypothetical protein
MSLLQPLNSFKPPLKWTVPMEPDGCRLVAYLERRTPWDS